jgi:hypothetical protein
MNISKQKLAKSAQPFSSFSETCKSQFIFIYDYFTYKVRLSTESIRCIDTVAQEDPEEGME